MAKTISLLLVCVLIGLTEVTNNWPRRRLENSRYWVPEPRIFQPEPRIPFQPQPFIRHPPDHHSKFRLRIILNGSVEVKTFPNPTTEIDLKHPIIIEALVEGIGTWTFQIPPILHDHYNHHVTTSPKMEITEASQDKTEIHYVPVETVVKPNEGAPYWMQGPQAFGFIPIPFLPPRENQIAAPYNFELDPRPQIVAMPPNFNVPKPPVNVVPAPKPPVNAAPAPKPPVNAAPAPKPPVVVPAPKPPIVVPAPKPPIVVPVPVPVPNRPASPIVPIVQPKPAPPPNVAKPPDLIRVNRTKVKVTQPLSIDCVGWVVIGVSSTALIMLLLTICVCLCCNWEKKHKRKRHRRLNEESVTETSDSDRELTTTSDRTNLLKSLTRMNRAAYTLVPVSPEMSQQPSSEDELMSKHAKAKRQSFIRDRVHKESKKATSTRSMNRSKVNALPGRLKRKLPAESTRYHMYKPNSEYLGIFNVDKIKETKTSKEIPKESFLKHGHSFFSLPCLENSVKM